MSVITIMEQALEALVEREDEIDKSIVELEKKIAAAKEDKRRLAPAIREQRKAIAKVSGSVAARNSRPTTRREPREGTHSNRVLAELRAAYPNAVDLRSLCSAAGMTTIQVRPIVADLISRKYVERVSDGIYRAGGRPHAS